jgi:phospholipid/cholesterol/gamma-HCH transport system ATP-binding protein
MIAEYKKKIGFTAILISHEIPDVFFISNRILALWDKKIVFDGPPDELDDFDHPFKDEIIQSIESLQEDITGLYSRRHFKMRYQTSLAGRGADQSYAVLMFSFDNMDQVGESLSHDAAQQTLRSLGNYIRKHFGAVGGFSTRQSINEFATILPFSDLEEARQILDRFSRDFQEHGMRELEGGFSESISAEECFDFVISVGMAQGQPQVEIESVMEFARFDKKPIGSFRCGVRR